MAFVTLVCHLLVLLASERLLESSAAETGLEREPTEMKDLMIDLRNQVEQLTTNLADQQSKIENLEKKSSTVIREVSLPDDGIAKRGETSTKNCYRPADFVFVLDSSGSVGKDNFKKILSFVNKVVDEFSVAKDKIQVGVMHYSDRAYLDFHLNKYGNKATVKTAVSNVQYKKGETITDEAIKYMRQQMFNLGNGARKGVPQIGIVITDGVSKSSSKTIAEANNARKQGIFMYAIGVGKGVNSAELKGIGNDPDSDFVFTVDNFDLLDSIKKQLVNKACALSSKPCQCRGRQGEPGRDGRDGRDGLSCNDCLTAKQVNVMLDKALKNATKPITGRAGYGAAYVRWGRTVCPKHSQLIYDGYAAGALYGHRGGGSTKICLPKNPQFGQTKASFNSGGQIYGAEYEVNVFNPFASTNTRGHALHDADVVCAVCLAKGRSSHVMIPARKVCPAGWTKEYSGYLMSENVGHHRSSYDCVDGAPEVRDGGKPNHNGALFYVVESICGGALPCPPYKQGAELTCVVCTR